MDPISVTVVRGEIVESRHRVHAVAVRDGEIVDVAGDADVMTCLRSAAKPIQALPLALEHPELTREELAIACASHEASDEQLAAVRALLERAGATEEDLECGPEGGSRLRHNCSGKHAGMLLRARRQGWPSEGYRLPGHPLQEDLLLVVAAASKIPADDIPTGIDGCGVVAFALSLRAIASMFSRLVRRELPGADPVVEAMTALPEMVGGPEAADTGVMRAIPGAVAKRGAEGLLCAGLPDGTGIAVKVEDGANRAAGPAAARFLGIDALVESAVINSRGERVGSISARS